MEASSTYLKISFLRFIFTCLAVPLLLFAPGLVGEVKGQDKVFVKSIESQSNTNNANNVLVGQGSATENTFATVNSSTVLIVGTTPGHIEQDFDETLPANTTSYVRIGVDDAGLLNALLGGSLGTLLDDVVGVLLGNHSFEIDVKNSTGTSVLSGTSENSFQGANGRIRVVQNALGQFFLAITPDQPYSRIRITDRTSPGLIAANDIDVYGAYYVENEAPCAPAFGTSFDGTGLTVDLLGIGGAGVTNPQFAIDSDPANYSEIAIGTAGIGASMFQTVYFNTVSAKEDYFKVTLAIENGGALTADLIGNIEIRAYNGAELVFSKKLQGGLVNGLDLLGLLQSGDPVTLPFGPGVEFDRVAIGYNSLISLSVLANSPIQLYSVERYGVGCPDPDPIVIIPTDPMLIQKDCAAEVLSFEHANFPYNAVDGNNDTYATLEASSGILLGGVLGEAYSGHVELGFNAPVAAGRTVYVRIDFDEQQLGSLLDGSVGELLGGVVDGVLLGNHYFTVEAKNGATTVLGRSSNSGFNDALGTGIGEVKIVQDKNGHYYVAVTSDDPFESIRITEHLSALVGAGTIEHMNVYHACFSTGADLCEQPFATYSESEGISLDLLSLGSAGVTNAHLAIDDDALSVEDDNTYSEIGTGAAAIVASSFQFVDFHTSSSPADYFKVKIGFENSSLLSVELLNNVEIRAYNGNDPNPVYSQRLQNGLVAGLDILGLLTADGEVTIPIGPGVAFDRIAVGVNTLVDVNALTQPIRLYSVKRFSADCPDPNPLPNPPDTESPFNGPDCGVELGEFENVNFAYNAIDGDIDTYATLSAGSGVVLGAGAYDGFIELGYDQPVPALETSYIRIDMADNGLLDALVGGTLGNLLADVGDIVLLGNHFFELEVRDAAGTPITTIGDASSAGGFTGANVRIVRDKFGRTYIAYTADVPYQSVRITLKNTAVAGLDAVTTMNVYSMCRETVFDPCEQGAFTTFDGTGLSVNLLEGANPAGVINPQYAIDDNNSNYSEITLGAVGVGVAASLHQDIYFKTKVTTTATDKIRLRMQVPQALANVDLLGGYTVYLFNGDQPVGSPIMLRNSLIPELDLLGLLNSGGRINVELEPGVGVTYDRIRFEVASLVGVGVASPVRLYNIYRISDACPDPDSEVPPFEVCADVIGDSENVDDIQNLTDGNHNSYATIRSDAGLVAGIGEYSGFVELGFGGLVPAGTSSYIRIGYEEDILNSLLAGSIGGLVNGVLNGVALGDHYFNVTIQDAGGNPITNGTGSSQNLFADADGQIRLVQDTKGRFYLEITPTVDYQSIRLEDHTTALLGLLSSEGHLDVYGLCHTPTTFECAAAFTTSYEGIGLNLDALGVGGGAGVQNAFWAIDQNTSSASTLSLGTLSVLGNTIQQNIQFDRVLEGDNNDQVLVRMLVGGGTVNAGILQQLQVIGLSDGQVVFTRDFENAFIEANIYTVLNSPSPADVTIKLEPGESIDEIAILLGNGLVGAGVGPNVSIYHVAPICVSYAQSSLAVTKDGALADGVDFNEVTATIIDAGGGSVAGKEVIFTILHVDGTTTTETVAVTADGANPSTGTAVLQITSTLAGIASVTATVEGMVITEGSPAEVTFVIPNNLSILKVANDTRVTAGGTTTFTVTITNDGPAPIASGKVIPLNERPTVGLTITNYAVTSANATVSGAGTDASVTTTAAVPVAGTITLTITADVAANAPATVKNIIDVWGPDRDPDTDTPDGTAETPDIPVDRDYGLAGNITKIAADGTDAVAIAGEAFDYTVTVVNGGPSTILSGTVLYLQDELSAGQTISGIVAGSANITMGPVVADGSFTVTANEDIEVTEQFTLTVTADVAGDIAEDEVNNTINIWSEDPAGDYSTPEGTFTTPDYPVDRDYGFDDDAITKVGDAPRATAGTSYTYTVTVENQGPSTILGGTAVYLQDVVSDGQTITGITSAAGTVTTPGADGEFTFTPTAAIAVGGTFSLTVTVDVDAAITANIINNTINIWSTNPAGDYTTPEGTATTPDIPVDRDYGFDDDAITKVGDAPRATAGTSYTYTVTVENQGPSTIVGGTAVYLQDVVSDGQTIADITSATGAVTSPGTDGAFTFTPAADIAAGATFSLTVTVDVDAAITADIINNTIKIWSVDPAGDYTTPEGTAITPDIPVDRDYGFDDDAISKVGDAATATAGSAYTYTVTVENQGPSVILGGTALYLQDVVSAGQTITGITSTSGAVGTIGTDGAFTFTPTANIAAGATFSLTVTVDVDAAIVADIINNTIKIWSVDPAGDYTTPEGTAITPDIPVDRDYGFDDDAISKVGDAATATAGSAYTYTVTVENQGPSVILGGTALYLQDVVSAGQTITGITSTSGAVGTIGTDGAFTFTPTADIAAGGMFSLTVTVDVDAAITADIINNTIKIWSVDPAGDYTTPEGTAITPDIPVDRDYGFDDDAISKVGDAATATAGSAYTYTVTVENQGPSVILGGTALYLQDVVSAGQTITGITSTSGAVGTIGTDGAFTFTPAANIAAGGMFSLTVTVDVDAAITADIINNTIKIWSVDPAGDYTTPEGTAITPDIPVDRDYGFDDDAISKVGDAATATAGSAYTYTVTVENQGPSVILGGTALYLQDVVSAGQTITGITSTSGAVGTIGTDGAFTFTPTADIAAGGMFSLTVTVDVDAAIAADIINNTIKIWSVDPAGDYTTPEGTATTPDIPVDRDYGWDDPDAVAKAGNAASAVAGESFSYTVTLTNKGASTINAGTVLYLQDVVSAGQTITDIVSSNGAVGAIGADGRVDLTVASAVATNGSFTLTVTVDVASVITADIINNKINIWTNDPGTDLTTPDGTATTPDIPVDRDYGLDGNIVKVAVDGAGAIAVAGEEFAYTVTVTNGGPSTILSGTTLYLQDVLSAGQMINSITSGDVTVSAVGVDGFFTATANANITGGETFTLTVTANVAADIAADVVNNTINIWSDDPAGDPSNPEGTDTTPDYGVDRELNLTITKVADDDRVTAGESTSFTLTVTNNGPSAIRTGEIVSLGERPSAGLTITGYTVTSGNGTATGTGNSATVTTSAVIPAGGTITLSVTADVDADAPATIANGIDVWGPDKDPENDTPDDGDDTPEIPVDRTSNLSISKVADDARVIAGGSTSFTVTVTNDGPSAIASGEVFSLGERPTEGLTITGYTVTSGNGTATGTGNSATVATSAVIPVGGTVTVSVTADVDADAPATIANGIDVWSPDKDPETDTPDDGDDTPEIPVDRTSNLSISKVANDDRVTAGASTSFTLTITNDGPSAIASGEVISLGERPSAGLTIMGYEVTSGNGTAIGTGNTATVTTSAVIPAGGTVTVSVTADVDADAPATIANGIDVWGPDKDPETDTPDDGDDTPEIPVDRESALSITKVADQARVKAGTNTTFTVTVTNNGPSVIEAGGTIQLGERPSTGITITGYEVISGAATIAGTGNEAALTTTGDIAVNATIVVRITASVDANAPATITNGIDVWGPDKDPGTDDPDDGDDTPEIPVDPNYTLSISKQADQARVKAGESTTFTVTITNSGPSSVASGSAIQVVERPGVGVTITGYEVTSGNATATGTGNAANVNTTAAIPAGGTIVLKITANIAGDAEGTITNGIAVWSPDKDPGTDDPDDETETPEIPVDPSRTLGITKVADQQTVISGASTTFTVTVTNNGPSRILAGEVISLEERPAAGIAITGYEVTSGNATVNGTGNTAALTTTSAIAVDGTIIVKVTADVTAAVGQTVSNGIAVWGPDKNPDTDEEDDETETPEIPVVAPYTLSIEKVGDQPIVEAGKSTSFTVTITNNGPLGIQAGKDIALEERPGTGVTITGYEIISGAATITGNGNAATVTTNGVIDAGSTIVVRITADVNETAVGNITNGIAVWGPDKDPDAEDPDDEDDTDPIPVDATVEIPNLFTPNGDGLNDLFVIKNLLQYQGKELIVINRWGNQVYKSNNYNNDWDGGTLAEGTYYYILRIRNSGNGEWQTRKGAIAIIRVTGR